MTRADTTIVRRLPAIVAAVALTVAACGSDDATDLDSSADEPSTSTAADGEATASTTTRPDGSVTSTTDGTGTGDTTETPGTADPADTTTTTEPGPAIPTGPVELALGPDGLILVEESDGSTTLLDFGTPTAAVLAGVEASIGPPDEIQEGNAECGNGSAFVAVWTDSILLDFDTEDRFLAWVLRPGSELTTPTGVGLGTTRQEVEDSIVVTVDETTLGTEFGTGGDGAAGLGGLLDGSGAASTVTDLWAGSICAFR